MVVDFIQQKSDNCIPNGQVCQAYDSVMSTQLYKEQNEHLVDSANGQQLSVHCVAPAYYYVFGINGEKFVCDFHFHQELRSKIGTVAWADIDKHFEYVFSNAESIKDTFGEVPTTPRPEEKCWCGKDALVFLGDSDKNCCNFHYRKLFYRYASNGKSFHDYAGTVLDYRKQYIDSVDLDYSIENLRLI